jgi:hypothetical protein
MERNQIAIAHLDLKGPRSRDRVFLLAGSAQEPGANVETVDTQAAMTLWPSLGVRASQREDSRH